MNRMIQTGQTPTHFFYQTHYDGQSVKLVKDKTTDELFFDADSISIELGYPSAQVMLADEEALDAINSYALENGGHSICHPNGTPICL